MVKPCNCCGATFNPSQEGVVGNINGKSVAICRRCCAADYGEDRPAVTVRFHL